MKYKYTFDNTRKYIEEREKGYRLLKVEHGGKEKGFKNRLYLECDKGHNYDTNLDNFEKGRRCPYCYGNIKFTKEQVKYFIEVKSKSGCKLISDTYNNVDDDILVECKCKTIFHTTFYRFKNTYQRTCRECSNERLREKYKNDLECIRERIETLSDGNVKLRSTEYFNSKTPIELECSCGNIFKAKYTDILRNEQYQCPECSFKNRVAKKTFTLEEVKDELSKHGYRFLDNKYERASEKYNLECPRGHIICMRFNSFRQGARCRICHFEDCRGENSATWKGGISQIESYLRRGIKQWKKDSMRVCNYKCVITGKKFDEIHHLYSFIKIVEEAFNELDLELYPVIGDYTQEELDLIQEKVVELHKKYPLGVCLNKEIHYLYHSIYGLSYANSIDFKDFKKRYYSGEFDAKLDEKLKSCIITNEVNFKNLGDIEC